MEYIESYWKICILAFVGFVFSPEYTPYKYIPEMQMAGAFSKLPYSST